MCERARVDLHVGRSIRFQRLVRVLNLSLKKNNYKHFEKTFRIRAIGLRWED